MTQGKGMLAVWAALTAVVIGGLTFGVLALLGGSDTQAQEVVVDEPVGEQLDDVGAEEEDAPEVTPPPAVDSVLDDGVAFHAVEAYTLTEISDLRPSLGAGDVLVTDGKYQAVLGAEIIDASEVYLVDVQEETAEEVAEGTTGAAQPSWTVHMRFNDAAALKAATSDLGCNESPDNMIAMVKGADLLRLVALPEHYCGTGFARGQILWLTLYGEDALTSAEAEAEARELAAALLGEEPGES